MGGCLRQYGMVAIRSGVKPERLRVGSGGHDGVRIQSAEHVAASWKKAGG